MSSTPMELSGKRVQPSGAVRLRMPSHLTLPDGTEVPIGDRGVVIGRDQRCDIIISSPRVSRFHALVRAAGATCWAFGLGGRTLDVNGLSVDRMRLEDEDVLQVGELFLTVHWAAGPLSAESWVFTTPNYWRTLHGACFRVGGGPADDHRIPGLMAAALTFRPVRGGLVLDTAAPVRVGSQSVPAGHQLAIDHGDTVRIGEHRFVLLRHMGGSPSSTPTVATDLPVDAELAFLPDGGSLIMRYEQGAVEVPLSELKARLAACLLHPPGNLSLGDWVPDELLYELIWPRRDHVRVGQLNQLLHRLRKSLVDAGVNGYLLLERPPRGGAIRFVTRAVMGNAGLGAGFIG